MRDLNWLAKPEVHDYQAAAQYLSLVLPPTEAHAVARRLQKSPIVEFKAKDILRASRLEALSSENRHVAGDLKKIEKHESLSPVLLVRGDATSGTALIIADGYHRVCAIAQLNEDLPVRCQIVSLKSLAPSSDDDTGQGQTN